jgi:hypothetical protein
MQKKFLFVCGVSRSGTTELTRVLSAHSKIVLGVERYKRLWLPERMRLQRLWRSKRIKLLVPELFEREQFFDFGQGLTNITPELRQWRRHYARMAAKFDTAAYVGDKMTELRLSEIRPAFPNAKFIVIIRNVYEVAFSWDQRARDPSDIWPVTHEARRAVLGWNKGLRDLASYLQRFGDAVTYVEYRSFFGDPERRELNRLLDYLDLEPDEAIVQRFVRANEVYQERIVGKDRTLDPEIAAFIKRNADLDLWNRLCPPDREPGIRTQVSRDKALS